MRETLKALSRWAASKKALSKASLEAGWKNKKDCIIERNQEGNCRDLCNG